VRREGTRGLHRRGGRPREWEGGERREKVRREGMCRMQVRRPAEKKRFRGKEAGEKEGAEQAGEGRTVKDGAGEGKGDEEEGWEGEGEWD